jgi:Pyruvate/2-oxoacid:ferredoxin oxidoreductase delta subunit
MCRYCVEYGNGAKWYLNPANYNPDLYRKDGHSTAFTMLSGPDKNSFEVGGMATVEESLSDFNFAGGFNVIMSTMSQHQGQVVPLEDALKIIELVPGDRFILEHCACRRFFGHNDVYTCLFFDPVVDITLKTRPWETDSRVISKKEALEFEKEMDRKGLVHSVWDSGLDSDGKPPIVICHCLQTDCMPTRMRLYYGITDGQRKGEYVAKVDPELCAQGCKQFPICMPRCPFGAMRRSPLDNLTSVMITECYGCGLCRAVCPTGAIRLMDRTAYPALVDVW